MPLVRDTLINGEKTLCSCGQYKVISEPGVMVWSGRNLQPIYTGKSLLLVKDVDFAEGFMYRSVLMYCKPGKKHVSAKFEFMLECKKLGGQSATHNT